MTVYVEYVFFDNFVIDLMLFNTAFKITGKSASRARLVFCAFLGACFALLYPLITENVLIITSAKILFGLFLTFCAAKFSSAKDYVTFTAVFLGLTFFVGGIVIGAFSLFNIGYSAEYSVALIALPVCVAIFAVKRLVRFFYRQKDLSHLTVNAEIVCGGKSIGIKGFFDTGNGLYDGFSPVILVSKRAVLPILGVATLKSAKRFSVSTAVGTDKKISFKPDALVIYSGSKKNIFNNVRVCVVNKTFSGYDAILHPALMEKENEEDFAVKTEKIS